MVQKNEKRPRGRPRAYDPETALTQATDAFWRAGYSGTSLDTLSAATGMNRPSLYGAFGDKRTLYLATLERYAEDGLRLMRSALANDIPLVQALRQVYEGALRMYFPEGDSALGCFLIGTAATECVADADVRARLGEALRRFDGAFEARLRHAHATGEIDPAADPVALSKIASAVLHTLALRSRAGDPVESLRATADAGIGMICGKSPAITPPRP